MARGTVKFFNFDKGFGFITPVDGGGDAFVHISAVKRSGLHGLDEGDQVEFTVEQDRRSGRASAEQLSQISKGSGAGSPASTPRRSAGAERSAGSSAREAREPAGTGEGTVKWFNPTKGFGFIQPQDGGEDIFVHISAVERAGLSALPDGQRIRYALERDRRTGKSSATELVLL